MGILTNQAHEIYLSMKETGKVSVNDVEVLITVIRAKDQRIDSLKDDIIWWKAEVQRALERK